MKTRIAALIALFCIPSRIKNSLLRLLGWQIKSDVYIGFSYIKSSKISIGKGVSIKHGNFINVDSLNLSKNSYIQSFNNISGPINIELKEKAAIGNLNRIIRAKYPGSWGDSKLFLGELSKITSRHYIECGQSIIFGNFSILAGSGSQMWTHGFVHAPDGPDRYRVDGSIQIGNNVYIGSNSVFNPGIKICNATTIGSNSTVTKSITEPGLYVNQPLRKIDIDYEKGLNKYPKIDLPESAGIVLHKKND
jgi:acetyltransferase-like isoleucine patch superfamily enzyme